ncbi:MAG: IMP cyclohydrolase [Eubacteriales bacterium]|nr:IMP cyclohydrolase [Eubacteriales bacterium]
MNIYEAKSMGERISGNSYVGRGIVIGMTPDEKNAAVAYFIMGRSENSRNRVFLKEGDEVVIHPFDAGKVADPSLIIYAPIRQYENHLIVTNGNQTDTIYDFLSQGKTFAQALATREFEPDAPNFTPRISGMLTFSDKGFDYQMSILKSADAIGSACARFTFAYPALRGIGHFLHTYVCDGNPIPTFQGEPERVSIPADLDAFTADIWENLDKDNRISLYTRYVSLADGSYQERMINVHQEA